jgi:MFS family permease
VRYVARHHTEHAVLAPGLALNALGLLGIAIVGHVSILYVATFVLAIGYGLVHANTPALLSLRVEKAERGVVLGYLGSVQALGLAIPPLFAGFIAASFSAQSVLLTAAAIVAWASYYFHHSNKAQA